MLQLAFVLVFVVVGAVCILWVFILSKLLPLYRTGVVQGGYRTAFQVAVALLSWVTMQIVAWLLLRQDAIAMMLTVLWAMGLIAWLALSAVARTRRQMQSETAKAEPPRKVDRPDKPDISRYTVRRASVAPAVPMASGTPRSARVRRIMSMEGSNGD